MRIDPVNFLYKAEGHVQHPNTKKRDELEETVHQARDNGNVPALSTTFSKRPILQVPFISLLHYS
jgi:hypothetical protein